MKKVFAALAASAVAVATFAFAGCGDGDSNSGDGVIKGNYEEKTPEQVTEIIDGIELDKIFGNEENPVADMNAGLKADISASFAMGEYISASGSIKLDYKEAIDAESGPVGIGSATVKAEYKNNTVSPAQNMSVNVTGKVYNSNEYLYGEASGTVPGVELGNGVKAKINLSELVAAIGGNADDPAPVAFYAANDVMSVSGLLAMAQQFGVKVAIDDADGVKIKLSVTEETVWKIAAAAGADAGIDETKLTEIKELITFNTFKFDVYFAIDKDGKFAGASAVIDISATADPSLILAGGAGNPTPTAAQAATQIPDVTVKIKGSIELYTHSDKVEIPASVTSDAAYVDMTDTVIDIVKNAGNGDSGENNENSYNEEKAA